MQRPRPPIHDRFGERTLRTMHFLLALLPFVTSAAFCQNIVLTNDDGWAVAQIRAQNNALIAAGFNVRDVTRTLRPTAL